MLIPLLAFAFASLVVAAVALVFAPGGPGTIEQRLGELTGAPEKPIDADPAYEQAIVAALKRMGAVAPKSISEMGKLQQKLIYAGYRSREALVVFFGVRLAFAVGCFFLLATPIVFRPNVMIALAGCAMGYLLPTMVLGRLAAKRQHRIRLGLPDVLDLLVVSVEAGLGLDSLRELLGFDRLVVDHLVMIELHAGLHNQRSNSMPRRFEAMLAKCVLVSLECNGHR